MVGRSQLGEVSEVDDGSTAIEPTISELVTSLKSAFQKAAFTRVEEALMRREEKLKGEIEKKEGENKLLRGKLQVEVLEKLMLQKECAELKELASRLKEEQDGVLKRLGESGSDKREICELKRKNCELNCAKLNAETEVEICAGRLKVLEEKILSLEKDLEMMDKLGSLNLEVENNASVDLLADTNAGTKEVSQELESRNEDGSFNSDVEVLPETNPNANCGSSHLKGTDTSNIEIDTNAAVHQAIEANSGKYRVGQEAESRLETGILDSGEISLSGTKPNASNSSSHGKRTADKNADVNQALDSNAGEKRVGQKVESRLVTGILGSGEKSLSGTKPKSSGSSSHRTRPESRTPLSNQIVEIIDSDDDAASCENTTGIVRNEHVDKADLRKNVAENDPAVHKRALGCSSGVTDSCPTENGKRVKIEDRLPSTSPVDPEFSKIVSKLGDVSSSSSSSDDDDDVDLSFNFY